MPTKKPKRTKLRNKLDKIFSKFIRLRDSDRNWNIYCITCKKYIPRKQSHACHFVSRWCIKLRREEKNVHAGCAGCNTYNQQRHWWQYMLEMEKMFWTEVRDELRNEKYKVHKRPWISEMESMIEHYTIEVKKLEAKLSTNTTS